MPAEPAPLSYSRMSHVRSRKVEQDSDVGSQVSEPEPDYLTEISGLEGSTMDGAILAAVNVRHGQRGIQLFIAFMLALLSAVLEGLILFFFFATAVEEMEDPYEPTQMNVMLPVLKHAIATGTQVNMTNPVATFTVNHCKQEYKTMRGAHQVMLFVWFAKMLYVFSKYLYRIMCILWTSSKNDDEDESEDEFQSRPASDTIEIYNISFCRKIFILGFIVLPRFIFCIAVMAVGGKFLTLSHSMGGLILKALGLAYLTTIDEIMFAALASISTTLVIKNTRFRFRVGNNCYSRHWKAWASTVTRLVGLVVVTLGFYYGLWHNVVELRDLCRDYMDMFPDHRGCFGKTCGLWILGIPR